MGFRDFLLKLGPVCPAFEIISSPQTCWNPKSSPEEASGLHWLGANAPWNWKGWERGFSFLRPQHWHTNCRGVKGFCTPTGVLPNVGVSADVATQQIFFCWNREHLTLLPSCVAIYRLEDQFLTFPTWDRWGVWCSRGAWASELGLLDPSLPVCQLSCSEPVCLSAGQSVKSHLAFRSMDLMGIVLPAQPTDWAVVRIKGDHIYETTL